MSLDEAAVIEALGKKVGRFFLAVAGPEPPRDLGELRGKIEEYLRFLDDHVQLEAQQQSDEDPDRSLAKQLAATWNQLIDRVDGDDEDQRRLVTAGVRYFVAPYDGAADFEKVEGFEDDRAVCQWVVQQLGLGIEVP